MSTNPEKLTLKQERLVEAMLDPATESMTQAGELAGYKHRQSTHRALTSADTQRAIAERKAQKLSLVQSHAQLVQRSLNTLHSEREWDATKSVQYIAATRGLELATLQEQATPESATETHKDRARAMLLDAMERGMRIAQRHPHKIDALLACIVKRRARRAMATQRTTIEAR